MGEESSLRMPLGHLFQLLERLGIGWNDIVDISPMIQNVRLVKSKYEVEKIRTACSCSSA
jgi:Xaa-Pro aminopeptidase